MKVTAWFMLAVAGFLALAALLYGTTGGDEAGTVLLLLAAGLATMIGGYLLTVPDEERSGVEHPASGAAPAGEEVGYLPAASIWPFWIGVGATVLGNGLVLGLWGLVPGAIVTVIAVVGFSHQSRLRH